MSIDHELYRRMPGLVLGFHGCDRKVGERVLAGDGHLEQSKNPYDWLGSGIYFWESDPRRAMEFAQAAMSSPYLTRGKINDPFVVGAVLDLGRCLNLIERECLEEIGDAYEVLVEFHRLSGTEMPENKGRDRGQRFLDRAVLEMLHQFRDLLNSKQKTKGKYPKYDSVRGAFLEGDSLYPNAGFLKKNHIQLAIRDTNCIKGYFRPVEIVSGRRSGAKAGSRA